MTISDIVMLKRLVLSKLKSKFRPGNNSYLFSLSSSGKTFLHYLSDVYTRERVLFFALWPLSFVVSTTDIGSIDDRNLIPFCIVHHRAYTAVSYQKLHGGTEQHSISTPVWRRVRILPQ
jgi:hypothetical protein